MHPRVVSDAFDNWADAYGTPHMGDVASQPNGCFTHDNVIAHIFAWWERLSSVCVKCKPLPLTLTPCS